MISLVGVFGTGLFLSSGGTLATAGPVGMILAFVLVGIVVAANQISTLEVACLMPVTGSILDMLNILLIKFWICFRICECLFSYYP